MTQAKLNLAAALVLFFASILMVFSTTNTQSVSKLPSITANTPSPTPTSITWQTYKNNQYGFEFQYPTYYQVKEKSGVFSITSTLPYPQGGGPDIVINPNNKETIKNFIKRFNDVFPSQKIVTNTKITISGITATKIVVTTEEGIEPAYIFFTKNTNNYQISFQSGYDVEEKILSTFKFTK